MSLGARDVLAARVTELDEVATGGTPYAVDDMIRHAVAVMQFATNTQFADRVQGPLTLDAAEADAITTGSELLAKLGDAVPQVVDGPLECGSQQWIATARHECTRPTPDGFVDPTTATGDSVPTTGSAGLYTSTALLNGRSMWRLYLDLYSGSDLFPFPWFVWATPARGKVAEIGSASDWLAFLDRYPLERNGLVHPDWRAAAQEWDGVHLSLRAVVSIQSLAFPCAAGLTAPVHWDVETTYWVRWIVDDPTLIEVVD